MSVRETWDEIERRSAEWSTQRSPDWTPVLVALKTCSEFGEFGAEVDSFGHRRSRATEEAADVLISVGCLGGRWHAGEITPALVALLGDEHDLVEAAVLWRQQVDGRLRDPYVGVLDAAASMGRFAEAVVSRADGRARYDVAEESALLVANVAAIVGPWFPGDLVSAAFAKIDVLNDPHSGHRSALRA